MYCTCSVRDSKSEAKRVIGTFHAITMANLFHASLPNCLRLSESFSHILSFPLKSYITARASSVKVVPLSDLPISRMDKTLFSQLTSSVKVIWLNYGPG